MGVADELRELELLRDRGTLSGEEFELAKQRVLRESTGGAPRDDLDVIRGQNEVAQLDREWSLERERYMMTGRYGHRHLLTLAGSILGGLLIVGFGIFWTITAAGMGAPFFFPLFGVVFILIGAGTSIVGATKAVQYGNAEAAYLARRRELLEKQGLER